MEGHADVPSQSAEDPQELGTSGSSPSHLLSWSPARRPPSSCPNIRYCLEIHVTLMVKLGAVSLLSHSWMAPLVEDMLHDVRTGLTKAVITGPGGTVLFMEDGHWGRVLPWMKPGMPHSYSLEGVNGLGNKPTLLLTQWQLKKVGRQLPSCNRLLGKGERARAYTC